MNIFCCVPQCDENAVVHRFPNDLELFNVWIESVRSTDITFESRELFRVCDSHFSEDMKFQSHENKIFLKKGAYPDTKLQAVVEFKIENDHVPVTVNEIYGDTTEKEKEVVQNPNSILLLNNNSVYSTETKPDLSQPSTSRENTSIFKTEGQKGIDKKNNEEVLKKLAIIISGQLQTTRGQLKKAKRVFELKCQLYKEKLNFVKLKKEKFLVEHILKIKLLKKQLAVEERRLQRNCIRCRRLRQ